MYLDIAVKKFHRLKPTIKSWGPSYEIKFKIRVNKFDGQVLHLGTGKRDEDGVPTVEAINERLEVTTIINGKAMKYLTSEIKPEIWYDVLIQQKKSKKNPDKV